MRGRIGGLAMLLLVAGCAGGEGPRLAETANVPGDTPVRIGQPYEVGGMRYVPADDRFYDALGQASWYGTESGGRTANGETHGGRGYSAAHPTLPLPSYAEVTELAHGRTIVVRINDRGPFARGRLIDLSPAAAKALGIGGAAAVRVRRVFPPEEERAALRSGQPSFPRLAASTQMLAALRARLAAAGGATVRLPAGPMPDPAAMAAMAPALVVPDVVTSAPQPAAPTTGAAPPRVARSFPASAAIPPARTTRVTPVERPAPRLAHGFSVQLGAFGDAARALLLAREAGGRVSRAGALSRVRIGPFADEAAAREALAKLRGRGYGGAAIVRE